MIIYFRSKTLQKICNSKKHSIKKLGLEMTLKLQQRLMELNATSCLADISLVPPARCHPLIGDRKGQMSVDLKHPYRLLFIPANDPVPKKEDGGLDWTRVTEIEITDTH